MSREKFEAWGMSDVDLRITLESETYAGIAWMAWQAATASMQAERDQLAAECAALNDRMQKLIQIINNADNNYCMCGEAMETHTHGGCGHPTGMFDYHYNAWLEAGTETPATDRFLAEQRAVGVETAIVELNQLADRSEKEAPIAAGHHRSAALHLQLVAAELRNEVKV